MSEQQQTQQVEAVQKTSTTKHQGEQHVPHGRKRKLIGLTLFFLIISLTFLVMYLLVWQHEESTDDAYVNGHLVQITPQITGTVQTVNVDDTQTVKAGQVLVSLDDSDMQLAFERAHNELINTIRQNKQQTAHSVQARAQVLAQQALLKRLQADLKRRESLAGTDAISAEELNHARDAVVEAQANLKAIQGQESAAQAVIGNNVPLRQQPSVLTAVSHLKSTWLDLQRTKIKAPVDGQIAKRNVQVGQKVATGAPLMAVVPLNNVWVDANFKESQLAKIRIGQPVKITADVYGSKVTYHGKVAGLSAGTGAAFALLPAQNATGNWIKVVQRVPVRIILDPKELAAHPLRVGLSMDVEVYTRDQHGQDLTAVGSVSNQDKMTEIDWTPINEIIEQIFAQYAS